MSDRESWNALLSHPVPDPDRSDQGSWNALLFHPASGAGCEISGESGTSARQNSGCGIFGEDVTSQGGPSACAWCRYPSPWWHGARIAIRSNSIWIPQAGIAIRSNSIRIPQAGIAIRSNSIRIPQAGTRRLRTSHTRTIAYPIRICCPDHWLKCTSLATSFRQCATAHVSAAFWWCVRTPCPDTFCHEFQRTLLNLGLLWW